jgi:ACS family tartrate transporter-like MFS transporter
MSTLTVNEKKLMSKLRWKLIPYLFFCFILCMVDRVNISFAALQMNKDIGISASMFGMIAGIFFIAYFIFEVPSNVLMHKLGARVWITRILISWGLVTMLTAYAQSVSQLVILRCLLGVAEAGFYPCIILYFTYWFPGRYQARTISIFMCAMLTANIVAGPVSTLIMDNISWLNMAGWRWLFILEGIPAILCGIITPFILTDRPEQAEFLTKEEKNWLLTEIQNESEEKNVKTSASTWVAFKQFRVWYFGWCFFCYVTAVNGLGFWMPQIIRELSKVLTNTQIGLISMLPYICGAISMLLIARHSDKTKERRYHVALPILVAFFGFIALTMTSNLILSVILLCVCAASCFPFVGSFWTMPNASLNGEEAAVGIAIISSVGNLGGFVGPYIVGIIKDATQSTVYCMYFLAFMALVAALSVLAVPPKNRDVSKTTQLAQS